MFKFIHQIFNPHCPECAKERQQKIDAENERIRLQNERLEVETHCESCDILKHELEITRLQNNNLLERILNPPREVNKPIDVRELKPIMTTRHLPFSARRQALEENDREKAAAARRAEKATAVKVTPETVIVGDKTSEQSIEELEKELGVAE